MYRSKIPARQIQTANDGRKQQQRRKQHRLHNIFGNSEIVILFRDQHRQRVGRSIALCRGKIFYHADKGKTVAVQEHKTVTHGFNAKRFRRNIAEAFLRIGHQGRSRIQGITALRGQQAGEAAEVGGLVITRGKEGLIDGETTHSIDRAVCPDHGDRQQNRLFRGSRQGDKVSGAAGIGNRGGSLYGMLRVIGELPNMEFLRPLPMRHDIVCFAHAGNAPEQQQVIGHAPRVCPLHVEAAAGICRIPVAHGAFQDDEPAGAVRLPDVLTQRLEHGLLQPLHCVCASVESGKLRGLPLHDGAHVLGQMHAHDGDIAPHRLHVRLKGLHAEAQRGAQLLLRAFELIKEEQPGDKRRRQNKAQRDHIDRKALFHGAPYIIKFRKCVSRHAPYPPGNVFICRSSTAAPMSPRPERRHPRRLRRGRAAPAAAAAERRTGR